MNYFTRDRYLALQDRGEEQRQLVSVAWNYANTAGVDAQLAILVDPLSVFMMLVVSGVSALIASVPMIPWTRQGNERPKRVFSFFAKSHSVGRIYRIIGNA